MSDAPLIRIAQNPVPEGLELGFIKAKDGARLRVAFLPAATPRGTILVHTGWAEFIEKYFEVANDLRMRDFNVVLFDPRGQGYSQRVVKGDNRGLIVDFGMFHDDLTAVYDAMKGRFSGPYFILAHSMGGLIALEWMAKGNGKDIAGLAMNAPLTRLFSSRIKRIVVRAIARLNIMLGRAKRHLTAAPDHSMHFETNTLTHDRVRHERFRQLQLVAPEAQAGSPRFAWLDAALSAMKRIGKAQSLNAIKMPLLLVSADEDVTVDPTHHRRLAAQYEKIHLVRIAGARHEVLMEHDDYRDQFWLAFNQYIDQRLADYDAKTTPPPGS